MYGNAVSNFESRPARRLRDAAVSVASATTLMTPARCLGRKTKKDKRKKKERKEERMKHHGIPYTHIHKEVK